MMNAHRFLPLFALAALLLVVALPAHSQTGIIVNNADGLRQEGVTLDTGLVAVTTSVGPRIVLQYANTARQDRIIAPPAALQTLFSQVSPRIVVQYANTLRQERTVAPPAALQALFGQVTPRIVLQYANTSRQMPLSYPRALIGDTTAPQISAISASRQGSNVVVTWTTNEFADSAVLLGTQSGAYTQTVSDPLFVRQHEITLTGLQTGTIYYYRVRSTDLSGNRATSSEYTLQSQSFFYLPLLNRSR